MTSIAVNIQLNNSIKYYHLQPILVKKLSEVIAWNRKSDVTGIWVTICEDSEMIQVYLRKKYVQSYRDAAAILAELRMQNTNPVS